MYYTFDDNENNINLTEIRPNKDDLVTTIIFRYRKNYQNDEFMRNGKLANAGQIASFNKDYVVTHEMECIREDETANNIAQRILDRRSQIRMFASFTTVLPSLQNDLLDTILFSHYSGPTLTALTVTSIDINLDSFTVDIKGITEYDFIQDENDIYILDENDQFIISE